MAESSENVLLKEIDDICKLAKLQNGTLKQVANDLLGSSAEPSCPKVGKLLPLVALILSISVALVLRKDILVAVFGTTERCIISNNPLIMELGRPLADCTMCQSLDVVSVYQNISRAEFADKFAYSNIPILIKNGTSGWSTSIFSYNFFRQLYMDTPGALEKTEQECQFFEYNTNIETLSEFFEMSDDRAALKEDSWYIGWSNCDPTVGSILRNNYRQPWFLPRNVAEEVDELDWIFMGGPGPGAFIHLDHVEKTSWQAQLSGTKTWTLIPPPECEAVCKTLEVTVHTGDIMNTNKWYHATYIHQGNMSITIGSEFD